ncbi:MAG TPA: hypothetical protein VIL60_06670 [Rhodanobacter sp.]
MASPLGIRLAYCAALTLALSAGASSVHAASGSITFSGAVLEPTCSNVSVSADAGSVANRLPQRFTCGQTATDPGRSYSQTVTELDANAVANDRLLGYWASYASSAGTDKPAATLVIHIYE